MKRAALIAFLGALVAAAPALAQSARPPLRVTVRQCTTGPTAADRSAVFEASMPRTNNATTMALRFRLYERIRGHRVFKRVAIPGFTDWTRSNPNVAGLRFSKRVDRLASPAAYRVVVNFAWYAASGQLIRRARRVSRVCREPERRPDLRIAGISAGEPDPAGAVPYIVTVRNAGPTGTPTAFAVALSVSGVPSPPMTVAALGAGRVRKLTFSGPACSPGSQIVASADAGGAVAESRENNNTRGLTCPAR